MFADDFVPRDSTYITYVEVSIPVELYVTMSALAVAGIVLACSFLVFNVIHRNNRFVLNTIFYAYKTQLFPLNC